ncbi:MAG: histidine triad nucleotide-binding protein [Clostridia bacterium]|nr:histidine triad nucleotide-binding protein [Oscillospiraceae bacterium]MBR6748464.1 histidine triad nucleotide-binding protein [Clostridia bacterium]
MDCLFCKIVAGEIPSKKAYEDDQILAFHDIAPIAPVHILIVPKKHINRANELTEADAALVGHIFAVAANLAREYGVADGFRILTNNGESAGQTVSHLHFHLIGGRKLGEMA